MSQVAVKTGIRLLLVDLFFENLGLKHYNLVVKRLTYGKKQLCLILYQIGLSHKII